MLLQIILRKVYIALYVSEHLLQPFFSMRIGCRSSDIGQQMSFAELARLHKVPETAANIFVYRYGVGTAQARHIKSFAGSHKGKGILCGRLGYGGKRMMLMGRQSEVGMYLVGNYHSPVLLTDIRYPAQLPGCPDTPAGIMRITKNKRPTPLNVLSETLEINVIMPVMQIKRRVNDFTSHTFGHQKERMVYRSHYYHLIARLGKAL